MLIVLNWEKLGKWALTFVLLTAVFIGLQTYFTSLDISMFPTQLQPLFSTLKYFFSLPLVLFFISILANSWGYIIEWVHTQYKENYDFNKLLLTVTYWVGLLGTYLTVAETLALPEPYKSFVTFILVVMGFLKQALKTLNISVGNVVTIRSGA